MLYETGFLVALLITLVVEVPLLFIVVGNVLRLKCEKKDILFAGIFASVLTLPYLWFVLPPYILANNYVLIGELLVVFVEAIVYLMILKVRFLRALLMSAFINLVSFVVGVVV